MQCVYTFPAGGSTLCVAASNSSHLRRGMLQYIPQWLGHLRESGHRILQQYKVRMYVQLTLSKRKETCIYYSLMLLVPCPYFAWNKNLQCNNKRFSFLQPCTFWFVTTYWCIGLLPWLQRSTDQSDELEGRVTGRQVAPLRHPEDDLVWEDTGTALHAELLHGGGEERGERREVGGGWLFTLSLRVDLNWRSMHVRICLHFVKGLSNSYIMWQETNFYISLFQSMLFKERLCGLGNQCENDVVCVCVCVCFSPEISISVSSRLCQQKWGRGGGGGGTYIRPHRVNFFICNPSLSNFLFSPRAVLSSISPPIHLHAGGGRKKKEKEDVLSVSRNDFSLFWASSQRLHHLSGQVSL